MPRPKFEADDRWNDSRRRIKPHVKIHHSVQNHPRTVAVYADNDLLAAWTRIMLTASERGAAHTGDWITLSPADVERTSGRRRADVARTLLERLANVLGWSVERRGDVLAINVRNFARKQGLATRDARSEARITRASPLPTPHTTHHTYSDAPSGAESRSPSETKNGEDEGPSFVDFWAIYPGRDGKRRGKAEAERQWRKLGRVHRLAALADVHARLRTDRQFREYAQDAHRYLRKRGWVNDEPAAPLPFVEAREYTPCG